MVSVGLSQAALGQGDPMTDLEMTKLCAEALGYIKNPNRAGTENLFFDPDIDQYVVFNPLKNDAQAMALVKKFGLTCGPLGSGWWLVSPYGGDGVKNADLNRAIVECVAQMQAAER
jgi:hypothetical protein